MPLEQEIIDGFRLFAQEHVEKMDLKQVITEYAATPEFVAKALRDFVNELPVFLPKKTEVSPGLADAFVAEAEINKARQQLLEILAEDRHMDTQRSKGGPSDDWKKSLGGSDNSISESDIRASSRDTGDGKTGNPDADITRAAGRMDDVVSKSFRESFQEEDIQNPLANPIGALEDDEEERDEKPPEMPNFMRLNPAQSYRKAVHYLVEAVIFHALGPKKQRIMPLVTQKVAKRLDFSRVAGDMAKIARELRWRGGDGPATAER